MTVLQVAAGDEGSQFKGQCEIPEQVPKCEAIDGDLPDAVDEQ
jgi:hypothetical protein